MSMKREITSELVNHIIPFWHNLRDDENGGFHGYMSYDLKTDKSAEKGVILHSRILWFFSTAYCRLGDPSLLSDADHAYEFLAAKCTDEKRGGVYWSVEAGGAPLDTTKHTYAQAFAVYGLAAYYAASGNQKALALAYRLFNLIETNCWDRTGYGEAYDINWRLIGNDKLSENGVEAARTMNTLLHVFEAYSQLYEVNRDARVAAAMRRILERFGHTVYDPIHHRQNVFFDAAWHSLIDLHSYGHDIETAWLIDWGCGLLGDSRLLAKMNIITDDLASEVLKKAYHNNAIYTECENGVDDKRQVWWVQAEAVTGFINAWQKTNDEKYLDAAKNIWNNIRENIIDKRPGGEWFWVLDEHAKPIEGEPIAEPWKCPYHNGRMCLEMIKRLPDSI